MDQYAGSSGHMVGVPTVMQTRCILYQLPPFTTIHSILFVQFTCLTVLFDNLAPGPLWSSCISWTLYFILHAFLYPVIIFFSTGLYWHYINFITYFLSYLLLCLVLSGLVLSDLFVLSFGISFYGTIAKQVGMDRSSRLVWTWFTKRRE